ncbi:hypothetical protein F5B19DRAFT_235060 [Rostrohypoxylon terebratum]|nr:hypothetical protein F5B19DRAFT_235060 [Rostrohypoxylon terebratum]
MIFLSRYPVPWFSALLSAAPPVPQDCVRVCECVCVRGCVWHSRLVKTTAADRHRCSSEGFEIAPRKRGNKTGVADTSPGIKCEEMKKE